MAQVKKLQGGGNPTTNKYLMFNGTKIVEGDDNFKQLEQQALNGNRAAQSMLNTLRSNSYDNSMVVNTTDNGVDFQNVNMNYYNDRTGKQFEKGDNWWRRNVSRTREGKDYIKDFTELRFTTPITEEKKEDTKLGVLSHGNDASFVYHDQEDGTKLYSTGPQNIQNEKIIRDIFSNFGLSREELEKKYNFDNWGDNYWTLQNWRNSNLDYNVEDLITRIREGKATDTDLELLQLMRFNVSKPEVKEKELTGLEWDDEFTKGLTNADALKQAAARRGIGIKRSDDGTHWILTGNKDFTNGTWYAGDLDFLEGTDYARGAIHNGRLFTSKQVLDGDAGIAQYISPYISAWRGASDYRSGYDAANNSGVRFVGDRLWNNASTDNYGPFHTQFDPSKQYNRIWSRYFDELGVDKTWNITDITNAYDGLNGKQVMAYIDPNEQDKRGVGMYGADWVVYDPSNLANPYQTFEDEISMRNNLGLSQISDPYGFGGRDFKTSTWINIGDHAYAEYASLKTKGDQENTILIGADGNMYYARKDQAGNPIEPKRIKNLALLEKVLSNPEQYDNNVFDQLTKKENGGILKHQYGGAIHSSKTISSVKNTEDAKSDITKDHKLNGEDGGLTQAEKMQIGAAIGDLAGVGISFTGPVGNIAGAITGLGATATRFAADVKQDGFQAKDAWNAAGGALLDLASVLPFIGAGAKTAKALKVIKSAASPIMKALSLAGAANGAAAMSKVIAGEDITSQDLQAIIGGLGSSVIASKQFKDMIGDAKFASLLSKRTATSVNANKNTVPKATIAGTEVKLDPSQVKNKSVAEVESYIKNTAKEKLGRDLTEDESKGLLNKFGLSTTKGERVGMRWKNLWKGKNPVVRKSEKVDFETPSDVTGHSAWYYAVNPFSRNKTLGKSWHGFGENTGNLGQISQSDIRTSQTRIANKQGTLSDYALMRRVIDNPNAFGDIFEGNPYRTNWFGYPAYSRYIKSVQNQDWSPTMNPSLATDVDAPVSLGSHLNIELNSLPRASVLANRAKIATWKANKLIKPTLTSPYGKYYDDVVIMEKQGGILKGKYGLSFNDAKKSAFDKWGITKDAFNPKPYTITAPIEQNVEETIPSVTKSTTQQTGTTNSTTSGNGSLGFEFDKNQFASAALEAGNFIRGWNETNKVKDIYNRKSQALLNTQASHLPEMGMRFQNPIHSQYDRNISDLYHRTGINAGLTSDAKLQAAMFSDANNTAMNYRTQQNQAMSDAWTNYQNQNLQNKQKYTQANWEIDQQNAQKRYAASDLKLTGEADILSQRSQMQDKLFNKIQGMLYRQGMVDSNIEGQKYQINLAKADALAANKDANVSGYDNVLKTLGSKEHKKYMSNKAYYGTLSKAKGGKLRSTSEQMLLDNQKLVAKAIEKMNDNTMKLILKALS